MAIALGQNASGQGAAATVNPAFSGASTPGNLVVMAFASDDYNGTPNAGWTQSTGMEQQTFHGSYLWWRISAGETSFAYTIGSATLSAWALAEFSGIDPTPYDISNGTFLQSAGTSIATPVITPTAGQRLMVASVGTSLGPAATGTPNSFTNSFTFIDGANNGAGGGTRDAIGMAYRVVAADGSTGYSTTGSWTTSAQSRSGLIASFKEGAAPADMTTKPALPGYYDDELVGRMWF